LTVPQTGRIFISYRRADSAGYAGRIFDRLAAHFGEDAIFMDVATIEAGLDFVEVLENAVQACDVLVALMGKQWANIKDETGERRLDNPQDFVRVEVSTALSRGVRVIPVLVDGTSMPTSGQLPSNLKPLARRNAVLVNHHSFHSDANRLIEQLELALKAAEESKILKAKKLKEEEVQKKRQEEIEKLLTQADIAFDLRDWDLAQEKLEAALTLEPNHAQAQIKLDIIERKQQHKVEKAEQEVAVKVAREKAKAEQDSKEKTEEDRIAKIIPEEERRANEKAVAERKARQKAEDERISKAKLEAERIAKENAEPERKARENFKTEHPIINEKAAIYEQPVFKWVIIGFVGLCIIASGTWGISYLSGLLKPPLTEVPLQVPVTEEPAATEEPIEVLPEVGFAVMPGGELENAIQGVYAGTSVTLDGYFASDDPDGVKFAESIKAFEEATGITVNYIGNNELQSRLSIAVDAGDPPDIVDFASFRLFKDFARTGEIVPVTEFISDEWLSQQYNSAWREFASIDGVEMGIAHRFTTYSLVWYPKAYWDEAGYPIPQSWYELMVITQQIADEGDTPWCIGIESGAATGWVATLWTADMMLRTTSLENYDAWSDGELPFDSPEVKTAIQTWSDIWFNDAYVSGGSSSILSTFFGDSPAPMFEDPPGCWLHKQGSFITSFFPEGAEYGVDYDFFYFPPVDEAYGHPFLVYGDLIAMFNDRPEVRALMEYYSSPQSVSGWLEGGGYIAAHKSATPDMYGEDLDRNIATLVSEATSFRVPGSDLMPLEVAAGSFWNHITNYIEGSEDLDTAMQEIDASWPR